MALSAAILTKSVTHEAMQFLMYIALWVHHCLFFISKEHTNMAAFRNLKWGGKKHFSCINIGKGNHMKPAK